MLKAQGWPDDSEWHKGSSTAESCVPARGIKGQVLPGSYKMTSSGRASIQTSPIVMSACGLLFLPPPPPPRLIHKDFLIPIKLSKTK